MLLSALELSSLLDSPEKPRVAAVPCELPDPQPKRRKLTSLETPSHTTWSSMILESVGACFKKRVQRRLVSSGSVCSGLCTHVISLQERQSRACPHRLTAFFLSQTQQGKGVSEALPSRVQFAKRCFSLQGPLKHVLLDSVDRSCRSKLRK